MKKREESFPLLTVESSSEGEDERRTHPANYCRGATTVIGRWPGHVTRPWRVVGGVLAFVFVIVITIVLMYTLSSVLVPSAFPIPRNLVSKRSADNCEFTGGNTFYQQETEEVWDNLVPLETQQRFAADEQKVFFVKLDVDPLTPARICALRSAIRISNRSTYLIVIIDPDHMSINGEAKIVDELSEARLDENLNVMFVDPRTYFDDTPLRGFNDKCTVSELRTFAVRVATLWRFGGASHEFNLLSLSTGVDLPFDANASMTTDGAFLGVRQPCHAFMFALMKALLKTTRTKDLLGVDDVIKIALVSFCADGDVDDCPGVRTLSDDVVCSTATLLNAASDTTTCHWARIRDAEWKRLSTEICPEPS